MSLFAIGDLHLHFQSELKAPGQIRENHGGMINCRDLLRINAESGGEKMPHCNAMIRECIELVENVLKARGKLGNNREI